MLYSAGRSPRRPVGAGGVVEAEPGLVGNLKAMSFPDLLQWFGQGRKTGTLTLQQDNLAKRLYLREGRIISSASNDPREFLGQIMVSQQLITEAQLKEAFDLQGKTRVMLGKILVEKRWVPEEAVVEALRKKTEDTVYSLFLWSAGRFQFQEGETQPEAVIPLALKIEEVLLEGLRRYDLAQKIRRAFPTSRVVLSRAEVAPPPDLLANAFARRALELVDGARTIRDICLELHAPEFTVCYFFLTALERGYVRIVRMGSEPAAGAAAQAVSDAFRQAKELVRSGAYEEALVILDQMHSAGERSADASDLMKVAEVNLIDRLYRGDLPARKVPFLVRSLESLMSESLTPEEVFLVSRVNGSWDLKSIVSISPLREVDALRVLKKLKERGIISLKDP
jgi:uncharacterized protein DUF4388